MYGQKSFLVSYSVANGFDLAFVYFDLAFYATNLFFIIFSILLFLFVLCSSLQCNTVLFSHM